MPNFCICDGPETPLQKLVSATPRGYPALLGYAEGVGDVTVVERMKEACKVEKLTYHKECRRDLYNKSVKVIRKSTRYSMFSRKAAAGIIKPEILPPTDGAATQHSLRAYLQTRDWMLLQSMSLDPTNYGWAIGAHGFEPIPTLEPMAPEEQLKFTSCNCKGDCSNRRCSWKNIYVKCIAACGITCKNCIDDIHPEDESEELDMDYCYN